MSECERYEPTIAAYVAGDLEERAWRALYEVPDPEFPISLPDLGLVYDVEAAGSTVRVTISFTASACPARHLRAAAAATQSESLRQFLEARADAFATDEESSRYALGGVLFELTSDGLIAVGTDGRRLACQTGPATSVNGHEPPGVTVVPTRSLNILERALADSEEEIKIAVQENSISVQAGAMMLFSRLVEGRYPRWRDVFLRTLAKKSCS